MTRRTSGGPQNRDRTKRTTDSQEANDNVGAERTSSFFVHVLPRRGSIGKPIGVSFRAPCPWELAIPWHGSRQAKGVGKHGISLGGGHRSVDHPFRADL